MVEQPQGVEGSYSKPETRKELDELEALVRRLEGLREVITDPERKEKVIVLLPEEPWSRDFYYMVDTKGNEYVVAVPYREGIGKERYVDFIRRLLKRLGMEADIPDIIISVYDKKIYESDITQKPPGIVGGGELVLRGNRLLVYDTAIQYGEAPKKRVVEILQRAFPKLVVIGYPNEHLFVLLERYRHDREAIKDIVYLYPLAFEEILSNLHPLKNDREIVLEVVKRRGLVLQNVPERFRHDREIVLTAVKNNGLALHFASPELQNDEEIVLTAIRSDGGALRYANKRFGENKSVVLEALRNNKGDPYLLECVSEKLRDDEEVILAAMENRGEGAWYLLRYASERLRNDPEFLKKAEKILGKRF
jgi:hypothetical protein